MTRVTKAPDVRRAELIEIAQKLFGGKGYNETSVSDIVREAGVAQGTFYWYFKSKEEILDAAAESLAEQIFGDIGKALDNPGLGALEKINAMFEVFNVLAMTSGKLVAEFHKPEFSRYHDKMARIFITRLKTILSRVIAQGVEEGVFDTPYPEAAAVFILTPGLYTEENISHPEGRIADESFTKAYADMVNRVLGIKEKPGIRVI